MANNTINHSDLECAVIARNYFDAYRSGQIQAGFEKFVLTSTKSDYAMFVNPSYKADPHDDTIRIFRCDVRKGSDGRSTTAGTAVELIYPREDDDEDKLWQAFEKFCATPPYYKKGGLIYHNGKSQTPVDNAWLKSVIREVMAEMESENSNS